MRLKVTAKTSDGVPAPHPQTKPNAPTTTQAWRLAQGAQRPAGEGL